MLSKPFLAIAAVAWLLPMPRPQITISPATLFAGQVATIHAGPNMGIVVQLDPPGSVWRITTDANGNVDFTPPSAGTMYVSDPTGTWAPDTGIVLP